MDILIEDNKIAKIDNTIVIEGLNCDVIEAEGLFVIPGLVDMHCELCEPGYDFRESFESAGYSAIAGGFTAITCNPMTNPTIDNKTVVEYVVNKGINECPVTVHPYGALTKGNEGVEVTEIGEMQLRGIVAVSDGDIAMQDGQTIKTVFQYASMFDIPIILHCEDFSLSNGSGVNDGYVSTQLGIEGCMVAAETSMLSKYIAIAEELNVKIHIAHVSSKRSVEIIADAKHRGVQITAETSPPHYFSLTEEMVLGFNSYAKVNPPLRGQEDIEALIKGIKDGTIDVISSDHQPHNIDSKAIEFTLAKSGISSFETALSVTYTYLVEPGHIDMETLVDKMSSKPSDILTLNKGGDGSGTISRFGNF